MMISKTGRYALQAATHLAEHRDGDRALLVREIAESTGVPRNYLSKILHQLARRGVVTSERGRGGGFRLAMDASEITLAAVVEAVEPAISERHCLLGRSTCSDQNACVAHPRWKALAEDLGNFLGETSLADLVPIQQAR